MKEYRSKEWLEQKYVAENLTIQQIANICGVHRHTIWENLGRLEIVRRKPGKCWTIERRGIMQKALVGRKPMLGKKHSNKTRLKMSEGRKGNKNGNWKGGLTLQKRHFRKSKQYREWRLLVLRRDEFKCQYEGCNEKTAIAHHIKPIKTSPELKLTVSNGMAVCEVHHKLIHKKMRNGE